MSNEKELFITTDPKAGAKTCKHQGYPVNEMPNTDTNDITKSKMFQDFFGTDGVKQFQKIQQKENLQKPIVTDNGLSNKNKEANNESESTSDSH